MRKKSVTLAAELADISSSVSATDTRVAVLGAADRRTNTTRCFVDARFTSTINPRISTEIRSKSGFAVLTEQRFRAT